MKHLDEKTLELFAMGSMDIEEKREEILTHLELCAGCSSQLFEIEKYYGDVEKLLTHEENNSLVLSEKLNLPQVVKSKNLAFFFYNVIPKPVYRFVQYRPVFSSLSFAVVVLLALILMIPRLTKNSNPSYTRASEDYLVVYNSDNVELWRKYIGRGFDPSILSYGYLSTHKYAEIIDVDNDDTNEIVAVFGFFNVPSYMNKIYCFNSDGSERWVYQFERTITFGDESFSDFQIINLLAGDFDRDGNKEIIVVARHQTYYPAVIIKIDAKSGKLFGEYWHSGHITILIAEDFNMDGIEEIFFYGQNNGLNLAPLGILDPRKIEGHSPSAESYLPKDVLKGNELYYILFPRTDLASFSTSKRNYITEVAFQEVGLMKVNVIEVIDGKEYGIYYFFDSNMNCVKVGDNDIYTAFHEKLEAEGKLTNKLDGKYYEELRKNILYWDGEKFVNYPTVNMNYFTVLAQKN